jgi:hypothetical protein
MFEFRSLSEPSRASRPRGKQHENNNCRKRSVHCGTSWWYCVELLLEDCHAGFSSAGISAR